MKKYVKQIGIYLTMLITFCSCQDDKSTFGELEVPRNLVVETEIVGVDSENPYGDGSGLVNFIATAENAISYKFIFGEGIVRASGGGVETYRFTKNGINTYSITVLANGRGGVSSSVTFDITVFSNFKDDEAVQFLTAGSSKTWYWSASEPGHLGVGPNSDNEMENYFPVWYGAAPFEKAGSPNSSCIYEDKLIFTLDGESLKYELDNGGRTFFNVAYDNVAGGGANEDMCYEFNTSGQKTVVLGPSDSFVVQNGVEGQTRGTTMEFSDGGFMGYYIGSTTYEILDITENRMVVRSIPGNDASLAWYHIFTTTPIDEQGGNETPDDYTNLIWSDEFDTDGAPDSTKWGHDLGWGVNGWGNFEEQYYTDSPENIIVENGVLKITAKAQNFGGKNYTSARIKSQGKFEFTYGKVEFRAKLPTGGGTWPALWMLGANFESVGWPSCGEIDVMEHVGNQQDIIHGTLHLPGNSGGNAVGNSINVPGVSDEFHIYSVIWTPQIIKFYVDGQQYHTFVNNSSVPFNHDFFLIMNVAMGGNFGGDIQAGFVESSMEVDYVRVYQ